MKRILKSVSKVLSVLTLCLLTACAGNLRMTVLHVNDTHSHLESVNVSPVIDGVKTKIPAGGLARLSTKINSVRAAQPNVLFLHAGDAIQGTLYFTNYHGEPEFDWLNRMQCDAMVTGNHEFDKGGKLLADLIDNADFPVLAGNVDVASNPHLSGKLAPYIIRSINGHKVGIIGLVSPDTPDTSNPEDTIIFSDVFTTATTLVNDLIAQGINKIIILSHIGYERDLELARTVDNIDLIIGGHTHTFLGEADAMISGVEGPYPTIVSGPSGNMVRVLQAWAHTRVLGQMDLTFNRKGVVTDYSGRAPVLIADTFYQRNEEGVYLAVDAATNRRIRNIIETNPMSEIVSEDPEILEWLRPYGDGIDDLKGVIVGIIPAEILNVRIPGTRHETTGEVMLHGSELAPLVADSMLWKANQLGLNVDFAIQNAGGVRMDLPAGELSVGNVYELMPFENTLFVLNITGRQIMQLLESLMERIRVPDSDGAFPYTSHLNYTADMNRPNGDRITSIQVMDPDGGWVALDPDATYRLATNQYLADGRDGYAILSDCTEFRYDTGFQDAEIFMEYVQTVENLTKDPAVRIEFIPATTP